MNTKIPFMGESANWQSFVDVLRSHAALRGDRLAYVYLKDGETEDDSITFAQLDLRVKSIAAELQQVTRPGDRALLMFAPGIHYIAAFLACLYAGVVAIPAYPPRNKRYLGRFQSIVADAQTSVALTSSDLQPAIQDMFQQTQGLQMLRLMTTDNIDQRQADAWQAIEPDKQTLAFLQYTSGSTGDPKGVMVSHGNLLHNESVMVSQANLSEHHGVISWVPPYHDLGLILGLLLPLYMGTRSVIMTPFAFIQSPYRWLKAITDYNDLLVNSGGPNFAYDLCVRRITEAQKETLHLSRWDVAFNGAEPISARTYDAFAECFEPCGFHPNARFPTYGLAEGTLMSSGGPPQQPMTVVHTNTQALEQHRVELVEAGSGLESRQHVSVGMFSQDIRIVDPETAIECHPSRIGEIWIAGDSVAQGYWNRPEQSAQVFQARIKHGEADLPFLRTGDLGFIHEQRLFVTGRIKDVIIVRGKNHYPQDIEHTVSTADPSQGKHITPIRFGNVAAVTVTEAGEDKIIVVAEVERHYLQTCRRFQSGSDTPEPPAEGDITDYRTLDPNIVVGVVRQAVSEVHDIQLHAVVLIRPERLPKTSSGKIQHHRCAQDYMNEALPVVWHSEFSAPVVCHDDIVAIVEQTAPEEINLDRLLVVPLTERRAWLLQALQGHVARCLEINPETLQPDQALSHFGIDSLVAVEIGHLVESGFQVEIDSVALLDGLTLSALTDSILGQLSEEPVSDIPPLVRVEERQPDYPLSQGQRSMWFIHRFAPENLAYNVTISAKIQQPLNVPVLQRACQALLDRHPSLRALYLPRDGEPVVQIQDHTQLFFTLEDGDGWVDDTLQKSIQVRLKQLATQPFDLEHGPLFRVHVVSQGEIHYLLLTAHHIAVDMWSMVVLMDELKLYYPAYLNGEEVTLPALPFRYTDFVQWQIQLLKSDAGERLWAYWKTQLAGCHPILELPTDHPRPPIQTYHGDTYAFALTPGLTERIKAFAKETNCTVFMVLLAAFQVLLHRYTGQDDLLVGSPVAGRSKAGLEGVVGYFVDPAVLRAQFQAEENFYTFLKRIRETVLGALSHQDFPFTEIVKRLYPTRDPSRSPLFQAMFVLQKAYQMTDESIAGFVLGEAGGHVRVADMTLESMPVQTEVSMFDMMLSMTEGDGALRGSFQFNTDLYEHSTIAIMALHLQTLLQGLLSEPDSEMNDIPLMTEADRYLLTIEWNDNQVDYDLSRSLSTCFEEQVAASPYHPAVLYEEASLTYTQLNTRANQLAHYLIAQGVGPDVLVGVCLHRSIDMVVAILATLKAGGAYLPLDPAYPPERLNYMCTDSGIPVLLTHANLVSVLPEIDGQTLALDTLNVSQCATDNPEVAVTPEHMAYVIYTSGSTGKPKGVMVPQRAIVNHMLWMLDTFALTASDRVLQKTPFSFDASVWEFFAPLMSGATLVMAKPEGHRDGVYMIEMIQQYAITTIQLVPSALRMVLETVGIERITSLRRVCCGGEALSADLQKLHFERLQVPLYNLYGPTEAAIDSTFWACEADYPLSNLPIGRPIANAKVYILDTALNPVPVGVPGEIHIAGAGLANGYLHRPDLTAERFIRNPFERSGRLYKTGDLGRYLHDGSIEFLGRIDHQVKLRGYRIEMGEIDAALSEHPAIRQSVTLVREDTPNNQRLVSYVIIDPEQVPSTEQLRDYLKGHLPIYMIPSDVVTLDAFPLMPNGKIDRLALPAPSGLMLDDAYVAPKTPLELALVKIWGDVLGAIRVGVEDNFFEFGGHSLLATQVVARVYQQFSLDVPVRTLFEYPTIRELSDHIQTHYSESDSEAKTPIPVLPRGGALPVSFAQQRLWFLHHLLANKAVYNIPAAIRLCGKVDYAVIERALNAILQQHEVLRTGFVDENGVPLAHVMEAVEIPFTQIQVKGDDAQARLLQARVLADEEGTIPFDLSLPPLMRAKILVLSEDDCVFLFTMHHIISDGWSLGIFCSEFLATYKAFSTGKSSPLQAMPIQYADFAGWQKTWLSGAVLTQQIDFWKQQIGDRSSVPVLNLPTDYPRPLIQSYHGAQCKKKIPFELVVGLEALSEQHGASIGMTLFAAFNVLLYRYSGQHDIMVGFPIANRTRVEAENLIGLFVNTLAIKTHLEDGLNFEAQLKCVRDVFFEAFSHQDVPYEKLVEELDPERDSSRAPLFQVMFTLQNTPLEAFKLPGVEAELFDSHNGTAKFDLWLSLSETPEGMSALMEYNTDLFEESTIQRMLEQYWVLLQNVVRQADVPISKISLIPEIELTRLMHAWNDTDVAYPEYVCVHQLFEDQVEYNPSAIAVTMGHENLTYQVLNDKANQLAHWLRLHDVGPNVRVGIHLARSIEFAISILAVVKAGGVYVPLDEICPKVRLDLMLNDAQVSVLITDTELARKLDTVSMTVFYVDQPWHQVLSLSRKNLISGVTTNDPIYQIYTSGTSGQVKGVLVPHKAAYNHMQWMQGEFNLNESDRILQRSPFSFDASIWEFWMPLVSGAQLVLNTHRDDVRPPLCYLGGTLAHWKADYDRLEALDFPCDFAEQGQWINANAVISVPMWNDIQAYCEQEEIEVNDCLLGALAWLVHYYCQPTGYFPIINHHNQVLYILSADLFHTVSTIKELWERLKGCRRTHEAFPLIQGIRHDQALITGKTQFFIGQESGHHPRDETQVCLVMQPQAQGLELTLSYHNRHFSDYGFLAQLQAVLQCFLSGAHDMSAVYLPVARTMIAPAAGAQSFAADKAIVARFNDMTGAYPQQVAVCYGDAQLTYAELDQQANQLAHHLIAHGVQAETLVGLFVERSVDTIISILGVLKAGGCYVPIDPNAPKERVQWILSDAQVTVLITQPPLMDLLRQLSSSHMTLLTLADAAQASIEAPNVVLHPAQLAYIIYTSGSTGKPKGVMVEHQQVVRLMDATSAQFEFNHNDVWTLFHSYAFDFSVWEIWGALLYGGRLVIVPYTISRDPREFYRLLKQERVTVLNQTPSAFYQLARTEAQAIRSGVGEAESLALRVVVFGGEMLDFSQLKTWVDRHGDERPRLVNMYGITETTVHVTYRQVRAADIELAVRMRVNMSYIGEPIADLSVYLLDNLNRPVPVGVPGELCVGGAGVSRGYLNHEGLTASRFVEIEGISGRVYRSGDLACHLPNGEIRYLGRMDHQVQLRGFRIELGEIEVAVNAHPKVRETVAMIREDVTGDQRIVCYVVQQDVLLVSELRTFIREKIPDYMVPSTFVQIDAIALTANGKIHYAALPRPDHVEQVLTTASEVGDAEKLIEIIRAQRITVVQFVPTLLRELVSQEQFSDCDSLRLVFCGGDVFPQELAQQFYNRLKCDLYNLYGPAEAAIDCTYAKADPMCLSETVPIGQPISNCQMYVLDKLHNVVPTGVVGELYIGGAGLAIGYHGQAEMTQAAFIPHPFSDDPNQRLYKTGDLVRWLSTGQLEYTGRIDHQIKLRGYRVEMEEIEAVLNNHPAIHESVVVARQENAQTRLVAYLVSSIVADRVALKMACTARVEGYDPVSVTTQDISRRGLKLSDIPSYWEVGLNIVLELNKYPQMGHIIGRIVWCRAGEAGVFLDVNHELSQVSEMIRGIIADNSFDLFDLRRMNVSDPRRARLRVPLRQTCQLKLKQTGKMYKIESEDLSVGFMRVKGVPDYCLNGDDISLALTLPGERNTSWVDGQILWVQEPFSTIKLILDRATQVRFYKSILEVMQSENYWLSVHTLGHLRHYLKGYFPEFMIPNAFVQLDGLPLMENGKVDRNELPVPEASEEMDADKHQHIASTETEQQLEKIWCDVLKLDKVGRGENFFELGGHSLLVTQVLSRILDECAVKLSLQTFFDEPTLEGLGKAIDAADKVGGSDKLPEIKAATKKSRRRRKKA